MAGATGGAGDAYPFREHLVSSSVLDDPFVMFSYWSGLFTSHGLMIYDSSSNVDVLYPASKMKMYIFLRKLLPWLPKGSMAAITCISVISWLGTRRMGEVRTQILLVRR